MGPNGDLFGALGTTSTSSGVVFKLSAPAQAGGAWTYFTLYTFANASTGDNPTGFTIAPDGTLYGLTDTRGNVAHPATIFRLTPPASGGTGPWTHQVLHEFVDGPKTFFVQSSLTQFYRGSVYGVVINDDLSGGLVYQLTQPYASGGAGWRYSVVYTFTAAVAGKLYLPHGITLPLGSGGKLYGTTIGLPERVWTLVPPAPGQTAWTFHSLFTFQTSNQGVDPIAPVFVQGQTVYGTTNTSSTGGSLVYQLTPPSP